MSAVAPRHHRASLLTDEARFVVDVPTTFKTLYNARKAFHHSEIRIFIPDLLPATLREWPQAAYHQRLTVEEVLHHSEVERLASLWGELAQRRCKFEFAEQMMLSWGAVADEASR